MKNRKITLFTLLTALVASFFCLGTQEAAANNGYQFIPKKYVVEILYRKVNHYENVADTYTWRTLIETEDHQEALMFLDIMEDALADGPFVTSSNWKFYTEYAVDVRLRTVYLIEKLYALESDLQIKPNRFSRSASLRK